MTAMDTRLAQRILTQAFEGTGGGRTLTSYPTTHQIEALDALADDQTWAPDSVCVQLAVDVGATWAEVVAMVNANRSDLHPFDEISPDDAAWKISRLAAEYGFTLQKITVADPYLLTSDETGYLKAIDSLANIERWLRQTGHQDDDSRDIAMRLLLYDTGERIIKETPGARSPFDVERITRRKWGDLLAERSRPPVPRPDVARLLGLSVSIPDDEGGEATE